MANGTQQKVDFYLSEFPEWVLTAFGSLLVISLILMMYFYYKRITHPNVATPYAIEKYQEKIIQVVERSIDDCWTGKPLQLEYLERYCGEESPCQDALNLLMNQQHKKISFNGTHFKADTTTFPTKCYVWRWKYPLAGSIFLTATIYFIRKKIRN